MKLACHSFIAADKRQKTRASWVIHKVFYHPWQSEWHELIFALFPLALQVTQGWCKRAQILLSVFVTMYVKCLARFLPHTHMVHTHAHQAHAFKKKKVWLCEGTLKLRKEEFWQYFKHPQLYWPLLFLILRKIKWPSSKEGLLWRDLLLKPWSCLRYQIASE